MPTRVETQHFCKTKVVSAAGGFNHSVAVTEHGCLYTWGKGHLQHPAPVKLPPLNALAFTMGTHTRLGSVVPTSAPAGGSSRRSQRLEDKALATAADTSTGCAYVTMPGELLQRVVEACVSWPEGQAGELEGVVRLLGGMMKDKVSH